MATKTAPYSCWNNLKKIEKKDYKNGTLIPRIVSSIPTSTAPHSPHARARWARGAKTAPTIRTANLKYPSIVPETTMPSKRLSSQGTAISPTKNHAGNNMNFRFILVNN